MDRLPDHAQITLIVLKSCKTKINQSINRVAFFWLNNSFSVNISYNIQEILDNDMAHTINETENTDTSF